MVKMKWELRRKRKQKHFKVMLPWPKMDEKSQHCNQENADLNRDRLTSPGVAIPISCFGGIGPTATWFGSEISRVAMGKGGAGKPGDDAPSGHHAYIIFPVH